MELLISKDDIALYRAITTNVDASRVEPYILEAQMFDIRPLLNVNDGLLLEAIIAENEETTPDPRNDAVIELLKPAICYFAYARFIEYQSVTVTRFGVVKKQNDTSESADEATIARLVRQARNGAEAYMTDVLKYLDDNRDFFTEWKGGEFDPIKRRSGGIRIRAIGGDSVAGDPYGDRLC